MSIFLGATINNEHTLRDWGAAITNSDIISVPEPNLTVLEVPGRNGRLDLSEALSGDVTYGNREIKLELASHVSIDSWYEKCLRIFNTYHGRQVQVIFDDDSTHFYKGRATVSDPQRVRNGGTFVFAVSAEPFRYAVSQTSKVISGTGTNSIVVSGRMPVCPTITATAACEMVIGDVTYSLVAGEQTFVIPFSTGNTEIKINNLSSGNTVTFTYREGWL